jgi:hypothetical protein
MRLVTFVPAAAPGTTVHVTVLSGRAGGLRANVERWYREMGLSPPTEEALAALPRAAALGAEGVLVALEGAFSGPGSAAPREGWGLLGLVLERAQGSVFVKMTGPAEEVRAERARFLAFCASLSE